MFERFTDNARRLVVCAQEESRLLGHDSIGTEHLLLGSLREEAGIAARSLRALNLSLLQLRDEVAEVVQPARGAVSDHVPFSPRAKKVLEMSHEESRALGDDLIGTEHILLALCREGEGVGAQILRKRGCDYSVVRSEVLRFRAEWQWREPPSAGGRAYASAHGALPSTREFGDVEPASFPRCPGCGAAIEETAAYKVLDVTKDAGSETVKVTFVFCGACGTTLTSEILGDNR